MNKITSIHLNGKAYQLEEEGFDALRKYLSRAESQLKDNPDKSEILADLEQAIAEKCSHFLTPVKDVITAQEISEIIQEMGPVSGAAESETADDASKDDARAPKRLYLIREGAMIAGVCTGLAAYFDIDVTVIRVLFVALTILTGGGWILVYLALMFLVPYANTTEERARAHGEVFNAQEVVNRAKESYARLTNKEEWKSWKREFRREKARIKAMAQSERAYRASPFLGVVSVLLAVLWIAALISLIVTGAIFGWVVTAFIPLWLAIVLLFLVYHIVTSPMRAARWRRVGQEWIPEQYAYSGWHGFTDALILLSLVVCLWLAYVRIPEFHVFVDGIPQTIQHTIEAIEAK